MSGTGRLLLGLLASTALASCSPRPRKDGLPPCPSGLWCATPAVAETFASSRAQNVGACPNELSFERLQQMTLEERMALRRDPTHAGIAIHAVAGAFHPQASQRAVDDRAAETCCYALLRECVNK
jgi:hypothetical protein